MKDAFQVFREPRLVALTGVSAAVYVAAMLPFKWMVIVPGLAEVRPAAAFPVVFSFLFGPAGAWGAAFGNLAGDMLGGMLGPGSVFGFFANFAYGYLPYKLWEALAPGRSVTDELAAAAAKTSKAGRIGRTAGLALALNLLLYAGALLVGQLRGALDATAALELSFRGQALGATATAVIAFMAMTAVSVILIVRFSPWRFVLAIFMAGLACAAIIAWGVELLGFLPFPVLGVWILVNNFTTSLLIGPPLLMLLAPRVKARSMLYSDLLENRPEPKRAWALAAVLSCLAIYLLGMTLDQQIIAAFFTGPLGMSQDSGLGGLATSSPLLVKSLLISPLVALFFACLTWA